MASKLRRQYFSMSTVNTLMLSPKPSVTWCRHRRWQCWYKGRCVPKFVSYYNTGRVSRVESHSYHQSAEKSGLQHSFGGTRLITAHFLPPVGGSDIEGDNVDIRKDGVQSSPLIIIQDGFLGWKVIHIIKPQRNLVCNTSSAVKGLLRHTASRR